MPVEGWLMNTQGDNTRLTLTDSEGTNERSCEASSAELAQRVSE